MAPKQHDSESIEFRASYIRTPVKDVIAGKLRLAEDELVFEPNNIAEMAGEDKLRIPLYKIIEIKKESAGRGIIYSLTNGWLAGHLHIKLNNNTEYAFTVFSVEEKINRLSPIIKSATEPDSEINKSGDGDKTNDNTEYCSSCGNEVSIEMKYCPDCGAELK